MEKEMKPKVQKKEIKVVEYFTDEMGKNIYPFQEKIKSTVSTTIRPITFKVGKRK